ncbi:MAG: hypothetical protein S4CHLAM20_04150 [Chlamydiia bacterium]|nr:hypothetical protein [Chlamydiia bacterium]
MPISSAVSPGRVSRVVGYQLEKGDFREVSPNLPQRIAILGEANIDNQGSLDTTPRQITSAQEAGELYGYGSPIYAMMRILRPVSGSGVGGVPTVVYPQAEAVGAVAAERSITVSGSPTSNGVHYVKINGREQIDGDDYAVSITTDDTPTTIAAKISDAINGVLKSPVKAVSAAAVSTVTAKWASVTSEQLKIEMSTGDTDLGVTYVVASEAVGSGVADISDALNNFGNEWSTIVINSYDEAKFAALEAFNGVPGSTPTGRYSPIVFKPFVSMWGSVDSDKDNIIAITDATARKSQLTNCLCPAPNSQGFTFEASANGAFLAAVTFESNPNLDVSNKSYPDMPVPLDGNIGDFSDYENRDLMAKSGASTVDLINGLYTFMELITTYHPDGENPPQFRYVRNLVGIDWNVRFGYYLLEQLYVIDHSIAENEQATTAEMVVKPKQWLGVVNSYADDLATRNLIVDPEFMKSSIKAGTGEENPDRFETSYSYKRSPYARISSTTATAGFQFGLKA